MRVKSAGKRALCCLLVGVFAVSTGGWAQGAGSSARFPQEELHQMLAPIALYPDALLAQILMAATYPIEVVEAERWLRSNKNLKRAQLNAALEQRNWDLSVKALVPFPQVLAMMSEKLDWTQRVGDAFLSQEVEVMDTIQHLRSKAYAQGNLTNTKEQKVIVEQRIIRVEPADPQVIYVPTYNSTVVYGTWWHPSYPPSPSYPAGAVVATGLLSFAAGVPVGSAWNSGWGSWNWGGHQINANINRNININQNNININNVQTSRWQHQVEHRKGNPYRSQDLRERYGQAQRVDTTERNDFRGFDQSKRDDLSQKSAGPGRNQRGDSDDMNRQWRDGDRKLTQPQQQELQAFGSANAFQGIGWGEDAQRFSDRGRTSRQNAGSIHRGGGRVASAAGQKGFASPEEAVKALANAIKADDTKELPALFGPAGKALIYSGDEVADRAGRERFVKAYEEINQLEKKDENRVILHVGSIDWPFPVPIVRVGNAWSFNTGEGREEMLNRRIGQNELDVIQVSLAVVDAQRDYAAEDRNGDGVLEYAQQFLSDPGKKNGLYWPVAEGEDPSPLGPLAARAGREGYAKKKVAGKAEPYHGYFYRILTAQGQQARGGARAYLVKGKMIGGFAVVAYPAEYGHSGIMTFIVNQEGVVFEKNLGANTARTASGMKTFDPDESWKKAE